MAEPHVGLPADEEGVVWADRTPGLPAIPAFDLMTPEAVERYLSKCRCRCGNEKSPASSCCRECYEEYHESADSLRDEPEAAAYKQDLEDGYGEEDGDDDEE